MQADKTCAAAWLLFLKKIHFRTSHSVKVKNRSPTLWAGGNDKRGTRHTGEVETQSGAVYNFFLSGMGYRRGA
jgi:hypothetical protein